MRAKRTPKAVATLMSRLADSIDTGRGAAARQVTAAALFRHVSKKVAEDDMDGLVSFLSDALDLAKAETRGGDRRTCPPADEPAESEYWLG